MIFKLKKEGTQRSKYKTTSLFRPTDDKDPDLKDTL